jgi:hypothetical protein
MIVALVIESLCYDKEIFSSNRWSRYLKLTQTISSLADINKVLDQSADMAALHTGSATGDHFRRMSAIIDSYIYPA